MSCLMSLVTGSQVISMVVAGPVAEKIGIPNFYYSKRCDAGSGNAKFKTPREKLRGRLQCER